MIAWLRQKISRFPFLKQFIKFCFVGATAALINFVFLFGLVEIGGIWYVYANLCGGIISAIFNFFANKFWTFRNPDTGRKAVRQGAKFTIVISTGVLINTLFIFIFTDLVGFDYKLSWVFATGIVLFWNFSINRLWTFKINQAANSLDQS